MLFYISKYCYSIKKNVCNDTGMCKLGNRCTITLNVSVELLLLVSQYSQDDDGVPDYR